jgi:phosphopantetheinyl transferase
VIHPEGHPIGVDIEEISPDRRETVRTQMTPSELGLAAVLEGDSDGKLMLMWSAKEALSKVLRTGLMTPFSVYEMQDLKWESGCLLGGFKNFGQYRAISFPIEGMAFALVAPKRSEPAGSLSIFRGAFDRLNSTARSR